MKYLSLATLLLTSHLPLYLMDGDDEIIFNEKSVRMIAKCTNKCAQEEIISSNAYDPRLKACNDICLALYKLKVKEKAKEKFQKAQAETMLARTQARQQKTKSE